MTSHDKKPADLPEQLLETPQLADALESDRFRRFLDHIPFAVVVAELQPAESITYANVEFERLTGKSPEDIQGKSWDVLAYCVSTTPGGPPLSQAILNEDHLGTFRIEGDNARVFDAWSNIIHDDNGVPASGSRLSLTSAHAKAKAPLKNACARRTRCCANSSIA